MHRAASALLLAVTACANDDALSNASSAVEAESLALLGLFADTVQQAPADGVLPYDVISVLYADEAEKLRFMSIPSGTTVRYDALDLWDYPDGTVFVKTFFFYLDASDPALGRRLLETRIIRRDHGEWTGRTYLWNDAQTEARRHKVGKTLQVSWTDGTGTERMQAYRVPNDNECKTCHAKSHRFEPLGPRTRQLNRPYEYAAGAENQIEHLTRLGWLTGDASSATERFTLSNPYGSDQLEQRARAYLDANCSHCHRPGGEAGSTALDLRAEIEDAFSLGTCRTPVAAGPGSGQRRYDIVPGNPDASIMVFRMESIDPELKMPELPTLTSDAAGTALVREWIAAMPPSADCQ